MRIVVALGGNALGGGETPRAVRQERLQRTASQLTDLVEAGHTLVVTHGNGPQVGELMLDQESRDDPRRGEPLPLDVLVAMTQAELGYRLQRAIGIAFAERGIARDVATVVTQVLVDADDPAFRDASKPVGPTYASRPDDDRAYRQVSDGGWRRVVPSPEPLSVVELAVLQAVLDAGVMPITAGGGGVPVVRHEGRLRGIEAVIDKDLTSALLTRQLDADALLVLTDVAHVNRNHNTRDEQPIDTLTVAEAREMLTSADAPSGSMGPKLRACTEVAADGRLAIIAKLGSAIDAVEGRTGTRITGAPRGS